MIQPITITTQEAACGDTLRWWRNGWHYFTFNQGGKAVGILGEDFNARLEDKRTVGIKANTKDTAAGLRGLLFSTDIYVFRGDWVACDIADGGLTVNSGIDGFGAEITVLT